MTSPYEPFEWAVRFLLGLAIVGLMATWRFNTPSWSRTYTTAAKYYLALMTYLISQVLIYYIVSAALFVMRPSLSKPFLSPILLAVVATTCLIPMIPAFETWRRWLQRLAGIPREAVRLGQALVEAEFSAPVNVETEVKAVLVRRGYDPDQDWFPAADPVRKLWLKASVVFHELRTWESQSARAEFIRLSRNEFDILRQRFDLLSMKVSRTFSNIERLGALMHRVSQSTDVSAGANAAATSDMCDPDIREMLKKAVADMLDGLREDIAFFLNNTCVLLARGVLSTELTENGRTKRLRDLGFQVDPQAMRPRNVFVYSFVVVIACMVISFAVVGTGSGNQTIKTIALRIVMIAAIQVTALAVAIIPKTLWGFANPGLSDHVPIRFVLGAGVVAVLMSAVVGFVFRVLIWGSLELARKDFYDTFPWLIMAFSTTLLTSFLIQDHRWASWPSRSRQQRNDAVVMGLGMCVSMYIVQFCLWMMGSTAHLADPVSLVAMGLVALVMGSFIGYAVPSSFRDGRPLRDAQEASHPARLSTSTGSLEPSLAAGAGVVKR